MQLNTYIFEADNTWQTISYFAPNSSFNTIAYISPWQLGRPIW